MNADLVVGSLASHRKAQHKVDRGELKDLPPTNPPYKVRTYRISFPRAAGNIACPVLGMPREGDKPQRTPVALLPLPRSGHGSDPGRGEPPPFAMS